MLRVRAAGVADLATVVGRMPAIASGEAIQAGGVWVRDRTHGMQFQAAWVRTAAPTSLEGHREVPGVGAAEGHRPALRQAARRRVRRRGLRRHRDDAGSAARRRGHRPAAGARASATAGVAARGARHHGLPARPRRRHVAGAAHLQDLRRRRDPDPARQPVSPGARHPRHRLRRRRQDGRASSASRRRR